MPAAPQGNACSTLACELLGLQYGTSLKGFWYIIFPMRSFVTRHSKQLTDVYSCLQGILLSTDPCVDNGNPCFEGVSCTKVTDTEFTCGACPRGLRGDGRGAEGCLPVNECEEASPCFPGAECVDLLEGYQCGDCPAGYLGETLRGYELHDSIVLQQVTFSSSF